ncbi:B3 domain-containing protein [Apostasia shenzhenica]|uniref:B3 domain-containing protein n=1 Tax=Apostasia shenzhenica TaxID=1088818 RepID=A0A2I0B922_9ASPA|nr:B3 domain-containing protein [Apostasia shenzhenica]
MAGEKGLLLSLSKTRAGHSCGFRYSYWTSSQSYVLTKRAGALRHKREGNSTAGDVVLYLRRAQRRRLYIGCRRQVLPGLCSSRNAGLAPPQTRKRVLPGVAVLHLMPELAFSFPRCFLSRS